jgi:hypothetical protein
VGRQKPEARGGFPDDDQGAEPDIFRFGRKHFEQTAALRVKFMRQTTHMNYGLEYE